MLKVLFEEDIDYIKSMIWKEICSYNEENKKNKRKNGLWDCYPDIIILKRFILENNPRCALVF